MKRTYLAEINSPKLRVSLFYTEEGFITKVTRLDEGRVINVNEFPSTSEEHLVRNLLDCGIHFTIANALLDIAHGIISMDIVNEWYESQTIREVKSWGIKDWDKLDRYVKYNIYFNKNNYIPREY